MRARAQSVRVHPGHDPARDEDPSDSIDLVAIGTVITTDNGESQRDLATMPVDLSLTWQSTVAVTDGVPPFDELCQEMHADEVRAALEAVDL